MWRLHVAFDVRVGKIKNRARSGLFPTLDLSGALTVYKCSELTMRLMINSRVQVC